LSVWIVAKKNWFHQSENHLKIDATHFNRNFFCVFVTFLLCLSLNMFLLYFLLLCVICFCFLFVYCFLLICPYFCGNSALEFKEIRLFPRLFFKKHV
jgi:Ca2+/Na+ antiporter